MYVPAEVLFSHFHHLLSLHEWSTCRSVCKDWRDASSIFHKVVLYRCVYEIGPNIELLHWTLWDLTRNYTIAYKLRALATLPSANIDLKLDTKQFLCAPMMRLRDFIAYNLYFIGDKVRGNYIHLYTTSETYLCTPSFLAFIIHIYGTVTCIPQVLINCNTCFEDTLDTPTIHKGLCTIDELSSIHQQVFSNSYAMLAQALLSIENVSHDTQVTQVTNDTHDSHDTQVTHDTHDSHDTHGIQGAIIIQSHAYLTQVKTLASWIYIVIAFLYRSRHLMTINYNFNYKSINLMRELWGIIYGGLLEVSNKVNIEVDILHLSNELESLFQYSASAHHNQS